MKDKIISAGKVIVNEFIKNYEGYIKSIWLVPPKKKEINMIFLVDDTKDITDDKIEEMKLEAALIAKKIYNKYKMEFITQFRLLTDYWEFIRHGNPLIFSEIRAAVPIYDPAGFFTPIKRLLEQGRIPGTKEAMKELISHSPDELLTLSKRIKLDTISSLYDMVVDASHALLIKHGVSPPIPKRVPSSLKIHLLKKKILNKKDVETVEEVIKLWKDIEHGVVNPTDIKPKYLDKIIKDTISFLEKAERLVMK